MPNSPRLQQTFFFILLGAVLILSLLILMPFLSTLAIAAMVAVVLYPVFRKVTKYSGGSKNVGAALTILLLFVVIIIPLYFLGTKIFNESQGIYTDLTSSGEVTLDLFNAAIQKQVSHFAPNMVFDIRQYAAAASAFVVAHMGNILSTTLSTVVNLILGLVALFYFLRDGDLFRKQIADVSPLPAGEDETITTSLNSAINSVILGSLLNGLIQGIIVGIGLAIFGVPNPTLWGTFAGVVSLLPGVGTGIVWVPATLYLYFAHPGYAWVGQLIWSISQIFIIDNFVAPMIFERGIKIHPLLIIFSILGGLAFFGFEGFLLGPLVLSFLFALIRVYKHGKTA